MALKKSTKVQTREERKQQFWNENHIEMMLLFSENSDKRGSVRIYADKDFKPYGLEFKVADLDFDESIYEETDKIGEPLFFEDYVYYDIYWADDFATWNLKQTVGLSKKMRDLRHKEYMTCNPHSKIETLKGVRQVIDNIDITTASAWLEFGDLQLWMDQGQLTYLKETAGKIKEWIRLSQELTEMYENAISKKGKPLLVDDLPW